METFRRFSPLLVKGGKEGARVDLLQMLGKTVLGLIMFICLLDVCSYQVAFKRMILSFSYLSVLECLEWFVKMALIQ
jgi:hypothetical protein